MIKTTIYLHRIGERLYGKSCDTIVKNINSIKVINLFI